MTAPPPNIGDVFLATLSEEWGGPLTANPDKLAAWHQRQTGLWTELGWTVNQWRGYDEEEQQGVARSYLGAYYAISGKLQGRDDDPDEWATRAEEDAPLFIEDVTQRLTWSNSKKPKKSGDKWVSPGRLVLTWPDLDPTAQRVLFVMAAHGNDNSEGIWCSQETITGLLGFKSEEPVRRAWRRLEKAGAISKTELERPHRAARWRINRGPRAL